MNNVCVDKSEGCAQTRPTDGLCSSCKIGYKEVGYKCIKEDIKVENCELYDEDGTCIECGGLLTLYID